jgi:hypothetical protein
MMMLWAMLRSSPVDLDLPVHLVGAKSRPRHLETDARASNEQIDRSKLLDQKSNRVA